MIDEKNLEESLDQEAVQEPESQEEAQETQQTESVADRNWKQLREEKLRLERERDEAYRLLQAQQAAPKAEEDDIDPDDYVNAKYVKKKLDKQQQENMAVLAELRLRAEHPDVDKVLTAENIKSLSKNDPHLAALLNSAPDFYTKAKAAYQFIKDRGIYEGEAYSKEKELIASNKGKPRSSASVAPVQGESPLNRAHTFEDGLTPELKAALLKEMTESRRKY